MRKSFAALLLVALMTAATPVSAFWEKGHEAIASIAWLQLKRPVRTRLKRLLAYAPELYTPGCPLRTIEQASIWADCVKELGERFSFAYPWHFQNVDICRPFDLKTPCPFGNCVSAQITRNQKLLADKTVPQRERLQALAFLIHFVGDLHQPLHAGDRGDLGGNRVTVRYAPVTGRNNLHAMWDGHIAERAILLPPPDARGMLREAPRAERPALAAGTVEDWSRENWDLARAAVYAPVSSGDPCVDRSQQVTMSEDQVAAAAPILRGQMLKGGLRLARLLDEALGRRRR